MNLSRTARSGAAALILMAPAAVTSAHAEDGGFFGFLRALGGGDAPPATAAPAPAADGARPRLRPLTVRRIRPRNPVARAGADRSHVARLPGKAGPVSIYEDPTLRGGDAVMTKDGVRVFDGAKFSPDRPYSDADFVAVSASKSVNPNLRKTATDLNKLPHG